MKYQYLSHLAMSWSVSRGRDTYGYNICRLDDSNTGKRYRCSGGGYDMQGTVFGQWLSDVFQSDLVAIAGRAHDKPRNCGYVPGDLYGMRQCADGTVSLDGACGIQSMIRIAEALGLFVLRTSNKKGHATGFYIGKF